jgi:MFS family permease
MTDVVPVGLRARAMSTLGGSHRIGLFIGPFVGAGAIALFGMRSAYVVAMTTAAIAAVLLLAFPDVEAADERQRAVRGGAGSLEMLVRHRRLFLTLGLAVLAVAAVRAARQTVLPLWAAHIGLGAGTTSLVFGIAGALDVAMFYPSGHIMDRRGRLSIALPSMVVLGGSMMLLPLTGTALTLALVAMAMSLGNGLGSGIMMTLGADTAPVDGRVRYLSVWRAFSDSGNAAGPVVMSIVATVATLAAGIVSVGAVGLLAAAGLAAWVPKHSRLAWPRDVAADTGG